jgi:hypothetical protein
VKTKVIKLNRRYKLYKEHGCTYAIRYNTWSTDAGKVEYFLRERYGGEYTYKNHRPSWKTHWGKSNGRDLRPYFIGVMNEEMIFMAKLAGVV